MAKRKRERKNTQAKRQPYPQFFSSQSYGLSLGHARAHGRSRAVAEVAPLGFGAPAIWTARLPMVVPGDASLPPLPLAPATSPHGRPSLQSWWSAVGPLQALWTRRPPPKSGASDLPRPAAPPHRHPQPLRQQGARQQH